MGSNCSCFSKSPSEPHANKDMIQPGSPLRPVQVQTPGPIDIRLEEQLQIKTYDWGTVALDSITSASNEHFLRKSFSANHVDSLKCLDGEKKQVLELSKLSDQFSLLKHSKINTTDREMIFFFESYEYSLSQIICQRRPEYTDLINNIDSIFLSLLITLGHLSGLKINHYNINPSTLYLTETHHLKLANFIVPASFRAYSGLDSIPGETPIYENKCEELQGTQYMAPEILDPHSRGKRSVKYDPEKADIFALGLSLCKLLFIDVGGAIDICNLPEGTKKSHKILLESMLEKEPSKRPCYSDCIAFLSGEMAINRTDDMPTGLPVYTEEHEFYSKKVYRQIFISFIKEWTQYSYINNAGAELIQKHMEKLNEISRMSRSGNFFMKIFESGPQDGHWIMATETYDQNLMKLINNNIRQNYQIPESEIWDLIYPMFIAFERLAQKQIYHKNIHPEIFLISGKETMKVSGFWVDGDFHDEEKAYFHYLAPEIQEDERLPVVNEINYDKADVFSLGLIIYQLITNLDIKGMGTMRKNRELLGRVTNLRVEENMKQLLLNCLVANVEDRFSFSACVKTFFTNSV